MGSPATLCIGSGFLKGTVRDAAATPAGTSNSTVAFDTGGATRLPTMPPIGEPCSSSMVIGSGNLRGLLPPGTVRRAERTH